MYYYYDYDYYYYYYDYDDDYYYYYECYDYCDGAHRRVQFPDEVAHRTLAPPTKVTRGSRDVRSATAHTFILKVL